MLSFIRRTFDGASATTVQEYGLIAALIAILAIIGLTEVGVMLAT